MADLARVVDHLPAEDVREPEAIGVRHGWATEQVIAVLREADAPLSIAEVKDAVAKRSGDAVKYSTVRYILRYGAWARSNRVVSERRGVYRLA